MAVLDVLKYPNPVLRKRCSDVKIIDAEIRRLLDDMAMTMYAVNGVGLAATQVGLNMRIIVIDLGARLLKLVNPRIVESQGSSVMEEGCLS
ncbi:MAG: peptide deformylase, partial [Candidatus Orphnella occulta]|nr:peptide deformylase [Candidatus Orphnella occulta]